MGKFKNLVGLKVGKLTVVGLSDQKRLQANGWQAPLWVCQCACGNTTLVTRNCLLSKKPTKSCGCMALMSASTHRMSRTHEYKSWQSMKDRTVRNRRPSQSKVKVCKRWLHSFEAFFIDMQKAPSPKHILLRIDKTKNYSKRNCFWGTLVDKSRRQSNNKWFTINEDTMLLQDWAKRIDTSAQTIRARIQRGWSIKDALTLPKRKNQWC